MPVNSLIMPVVKKMRSHYCNAMLNTAPTGSESSINPARVSIARGVALRTRRWRDADTIEGNQGVMWWVALALTVACLYGIE